jgi:hypothetical protein
MFAGKAFKALHSWVGSLPYPQILHQAGKPIIMKIRYLQQEKDLKHWPLGSML